MFTGIITDIGEVIELSGDKNSDKTLTIATGYDVQAIDIGASISHDGICLTVTERGKNAGENWYKVVASPHTQKITTLGGWLVGDKINLERALCLGDELGGHMVSGHIDGMAEIISIEKVSDSINFIIKPPSELLKFIAEKGSVTLGGVSLTVTFVNGDSFGLSLIPHTLAATNWGSKNIGDELNLEIDLIARYLYRFSSL